MKLPNQEPVEKWQEDFMDFYMETGKYEGRELGPQGYIKFIAHQKALSRAEVLRELRQSLDELEPGKYSIGVFYRLIDDTLAVVEELEQKK